jgi:phage-related minor tail protein
MTVEAKLKITPEMAAAVTALKAVQAELRGVTGATQNATTAGVKPLAAAQAELAKNTQLSAYQQTQLGYQLNDFFVQVSSGQSALTALIQQGSQLSGTFGGIGGAARAVLTVFTPLRLAIGGVAGVLGSIGLAYYQGAQQSKEFNKSLLLTGSYAGVTAGAVDAMAQRISASVGVSIGGARETIAALVATGKFAGSALEPVAVAIEKVSALTGTAREEVIQNFTKMADQGATKFAEEMNKTYHFLSLASYRHIKELEDQGRGAEAMRVASQELSNQLGSLTQNLGYVESAWKKLKLAASDTWDAMLGVGRTKTVEEKLAEALKARADKVALGQRAFDGLGNRRAPGSQADTSQIDAEIETLRKTAFLQSRITSDKSDQARLTERQIDAEKRRVKLLADGASKEEKMRKDLAAVRADATLLGSTPAELAKSEAVVREKYADKSKAGAKAQQLTRLAQAKSFYDADIELLNDANGRASKLLQTRFDAGLVDLQSYLAEKARLQTEDAGQDIARLQTKLREEQRVLKDNEARAAKATGPNAKEQFAESIVASKQKIAALEVDLVKRERERVDNARALTAEGEKFTRELIDQTIQFERQQRAASGLQQTPEQLWQNNFAQYKGLYDKLGIAGDAQGQQRVLAAVDAGAQRDQLIEQERELARLSAQRQRLEDAVNTSAAQGNTTASEAERQILQIRREQLPALQAIVDELAKMAVSPDEKARVAQAAAELNRLNDQRTEAGKLINNDIKGGFQTLFTDIVSGTKTVDQALKDMLANFAKRMLDLIAQKLFEQLFAGSTGSGGGNYGQAIASLFGYHTGGVVQDGGQTFTRQIPAGLASFAASYAPRYHTGGIAGFKPNERLAVLEQGEEVLTAGDPRHASNYKGSASSSGMQVNTSIVFNGAPDKKDQQQDAANGLQQSITNMINQWALNQMRPGGVLAR